MHPEIHPASSRALGTVSTKRTRAERRGIPGPLSQSPGATGTLCTPRAGVLPWIFEKDWHRRRIVYLIVALVGVGGAIAFVVLRQFISAIV